MNKPIIVFATNNEHKLREVREILGERYDVRSLKEIECFEELPETHDTLEENATEKAAYITEHYGVDCFADDTGLEVSALGGEPGVYSARYAAMDGGDAAVSHDSEANMAKLLRKLEGKVGDERKAQFRTAVALVQIDPETKATTTTLFEGIVKGEIATEKHGTDGFGYDPIFMPEGKDGLTFAEMSAEDKNAISHRGRAVAKLVEFLTTEK